MVSFDQHETHFIKGSNILNDALCGFVLNGVFSMTGDVEHVTCPDCLKKIQELVETHPFKDSIEEALISHVEKGYILTGQQNLLRDILIELNTQFGELQDWKF